MVERICPQCQHGNPLDNRFCGQCGAPLERNEIVSQNQPTGLMGLGIGKDNVPERMKQVGQAMALSLAALAAEAGIAWLRRRVEQMSQPAPPRTQHAVQSVNYPVAQGTTELLIPSATTTIQGRAGGVTIWSQRVVETWEQGILKRQTVERNVWRQEG